MNYRSILYLRALHSCMSRDTYFNILSWVIFSPFVTGKLCTLRCLDKTIFRGLTRLYFVDYVENFSQQLPTIADFCYSLWIGPWLSIVLLNILRIPTPSVNSHWCHTLPVMALTRSLPIIWVISSLCTLYARRLAVWPALFTTLFLYPSNAWLIPDFNDYAVNFVNKLFVYFMFSRPTNCTFRWGFWDSPRSHIVLKVTVMQLLKREARLRTQACWLKSKALPAIPVMAGRRVLYSHLHV